MPCPPRDKPIGGVMCWRSAWRKRIRPGMPFPLAASRNTGIADIYRPSLLTYFRSLPAFFLTIFRQGAIMLLRLNDIAPDFQANTSQGPISFHQWIGDSW